MNWLQDLADAYRERKAARHQDVARRHMLRRDFWRWEIEKPWQRLLPQALVFIVAMAILLALTWLVLR